MLGTACASIPAKGPSEFRTSLVLQGIERPLVVRRDLLVLVLHNYDAMGRHVDDARVRASVMGLVTRLGLVVTPFAMPRYSAPGYNCSRVWKIVVARADGQDFPDREVAVLATLRASPFIAAAGPLITPGGVPVDHTIHVFGGYQPLTAALLDELQLLGLTLGPSERTIDLPTSIGIDVLTLARRFASLAPDREFWPAMGPASTCTG